VAWPIGRPEGSASAMSSVPASSGPACSIPPIRPFLVPTKVPSTKHFESSSPPRPFGSSAEARRISSSALSRFTAGSDGGRSGRAGSARAGGALGGVGVEHPEDGVEHVPWNPLGSASAVRPTRRVGPLVGKIPAYSPALETGRGPLYEPSPVCQIAATPNRIW
jgi:hypothetical protein